MERGVNSIKRAQWIWGKMSEKNSYVGFVKEFSIEKMPDAAEIALLADTHYKLYVNGAFINAGPAPFRKPRMQVDSYDITSSLVEGENNIFVLAHFVGIDVKYNLSDRPGLLGCLTLKKGNEKTELCTNDEWEAYPLDCWQQDTVKKNWALGMVEIIHGSCESFRILEYYAAEDYGDLTILPDKGSFPSLREPTVCSECSGLELIDRIVPPLRWQKTKPVDLLEIYRNNPEVYLPADSIRLDNEHLVKETDNQKYRIRKKGNLHLTRRDGEKGYSFLFDLLRMVAGDISFVIEVDENCIVDIQYSESIRNGRPYGTRQSSHFYARYYLKKGRNHMRMFHFSGFRYLYLVCKDFIGDMIISDLTVHMCRADLDFSDEMITSDAMINDIYDISRRSIMLNTQANTYDCNTREQGTYWGDSIWITELTGLMTGNYSHMRQLCLELPNEYRAKRFIGASLYGLGAPLYDFCLVPMDLLNRYFENTGDKETVFAVIPICEDIIQDFRELRDDSGFINTSLVEEDQNEDFRNSFIFLDHPGTTWHPRQTTGIDRDNYNGGINLFYLKALQSMQKLYLSLSIDRDLSGEIAELTRNIRSYFFIEEKGLLCDSRFEGKETLSYSQITNALGVMTNVLAGKEAVYALEAVCDTDKNSYIAKGTPYSYFFIAHASIYAGYPGLALRTIKRDYSDMVKRGATTTWEAFGGENHDSLNHAWSAVLPYLIIKGIAGISPGEPGYGKIRICPDTSFFDDFSFSLPLPQGEIHVKWKKENAREFNFLFDIPRGISCTFERNNRSVFFENALSVYSE